jgi:hypothetical protein
MVALAGVARTPTDWQFWATDTGDTAMTFSQTTNLQDSPTPPTGAYVMPLVGPVFTLIGSATATAAPSTRRPSWTADVFG